MWPSIDSLCTANHTLAGSMGLLIHLLKLTVCCIHCHCCAAGLVTNLNSVRSIPTHIHTHTCTRACTHAGSRSDITKTVSGSFLGDLFHNVSLSGSVFVGHFYYRKHTKSHSVCMVLFSLWFRCMCVYAFVPEHVFVCL